MAPSGTRAPPPLLLIHVQFTGTAFHLHDRRKAPQVLQGAPQVLPYLKGQSFGLGVRQNRGCLHIKARRPVARVKGQGPFGPHMPPLAAHSGASSGCVAKSAGLVISISSISSECRHSRCRMPGGCKTQEPARRICSPCPSYSNTTQPCVT